MKFGKESALAFLNKDKESHVKLYGKLDVDELFVRAQLLKKDLEQLTINEESRGLEKEEKDEFNEITDRLAYIKKRMHQEGYYLGFNPLTLTPLNTNEDQN